LSILSEAIRQESYVLSLIENKVRRARLKGDRSRFRNLAFPIYRGTGFPITKQGLVRRIPSWKNLSHWMKLQIAAMVLEQGACGSRQITMRFSNERLAKIDALGASSREWVRNTIANELKERFGQVLPFYFVLESRNREGDRSVSLHLHGAIQLVRTPLPLTKSGLLSKARSKKVLEHGLASVEIEYSGKLIQAALKAASGCANGKGISPSSGRRSVRVQKPFGHTTWPSYCYKNAIGPDGLISERQWAMSRPLNQSARQLWAVISGK
jgi:hypothetical protein